MLKLLQTPTGGLIGCRVCPICGQEYPPTSPAQKYCANCRKEGKHRAHLLYRRNRSQEQRNAKKIANKQWKKDNPVKAKKWDRTHPDMVRVERKRNKARRRVLGFNPLNSPFDGCEGHHINEKDVMYIPRDMHRSVHHEVRSGRGMEEINAKVFAWYTEDWT
jgi:hypothetical protein